MASLKPFRKMRPSIATSTRVMATSWPRRKPETNGFSVMWAEASDEERVIVTMKSVAMKPKRHKTKILPFQKESRRSSIAMEPWPCGLSAATLLGGFVDSASTAPEEVGHFSVGVVRRAFLVLPREHLFKRLRRMTMHAT